MNTPAVTMVAAWMSAETGVGPSMASGSQVCSRNCADLPMAPMKSSRQASVSACHVDAEEVEGRVGEARRRAGRSPSKATEPNSTKTRKMPSAKPKSPTRLTMKALMAAALADGLLVPEADQQVAGEADALPAEEHLDEVVGRHQHQHGEGEERQIGEEARPVRILVHVADRVEVHERRDRRHDDQHHGGERIDAEAPSRPRRSPEVNQLRRPGCASSPAPKPTLKKAIQDRAQDEEQQRGRDDLARARADAGGRSSPAIRKPTSGRKTMA